MLPVLFFVFPLHFDCFFPLIKVYCYNQKGEPSSQNKEEIVV